MRVQLVTFSGCPHADPARERLQRILAELGLSVPIEEVDSAAPETAAHLRGWSSPTILVDGEDVEGGLPGEPGAGACRLYPDGGLPGEEAIRAALARASS